MCSQQCLANGQLIANVVQCNISNAGNITGHQAPQQNNR